MPKRNLTDRTLKALKAARAGKHYDVMDTVVPGFGVRVSETGRRTFILVARYPGSKNPTRRSLGVYGAMSLENAREKARGWHELIRKRIDPQEHEKRLELAAARRRENTFRGVAEDFIAALPATERQRAVVARDIRKEFVSAWAALPITEITPQDVLVVVNAVKDRGASHQARNLLGYVRRLFKWAVRQHAYDLERSPCDLIEATSVIGEKKPRKRVLSNAELKAAWQAALQIGYPYGDVYRLLLLTGARKSEIAEARWDEIDADHRVLIVPSERHKSDRGHVIWLSDDAWAIIAALPRFEGGDYLFSTTGGRQPINGFSKAKAKLDRAVTAKLGYEPDPFVIHDFRRSMRSRLATLPISQSTCELMIGHAQSGLVETYSPQQLLFDPDYADLLAKLKEGWRLWEARLRSIVSPSLEPSNVVNPLPANVVTLRGGAI